MNLSDKERVILHAIQYDADSSVAQISKKVGHKDSIVRYAIQSLLEKELIVRYPLINRFTMGLNGYNIFFSLALRGSKEKAALKEYFLKSKAVLWLAEMGADLPYALDVSAKNLFEFKLFLNELSSKFGQVFAQKFISTQLSVSMYGARYLNTKVKQSVPIFLAPGAEPVQIDELDHKILSAIANMSFRSERDLALKLGLAPTTFDYRIKQLRRNQVFLGYRYGVNVQKLGYQTHKILIYSSGLSATLAQSIQSFCQSNLAITVCFECLGTWDYELNADVNDADEVVAIVEKLYDHCGPDIQSIKVLSKFRDVKMLAYK